MGGDDDRAQTVARLDALRRQPDSVSPVGVPTRVETEEAGGDVATPGPDWLVSNAHRLGSPWSSVLPPRWRSARVDPGRQGAIALAAAGVFVVSVAAFAVFRDAPTPAPAPPLAVVASATKDVPAEPVPAAETETVVSVVGLVTQPGLVRLQPGSRIADAIAAAGGPVGGADLLALNMAARVADGDQIVVGAVPPLAGPPVSGTSSGGGSAPAGAEPGEQPAGSPSGGTVDLNAATAAELDALPGVGPVTATSIVNWREANGQFISVDQLAEVDGIGPGRLAKIRDLVHIG